MVLFILPRCLYGSALERWGVAILQNDLAKLHSAPVFHWDDIKYFIAFARTGGMAAAASKLGVNQSTVQRRLAVLEERLGCRLLTLHRGVYSLTELRRGVTTLRRAH